MLQIVIKIKKYQINKIKGFTLAELIVALGIFAVIITVATSILLHSLRSLRYVAHQAGAMDNISLAVEQMAREIRMGSNIMPVDREEFLLDSFSFINHEDNIVNYSFCGTRICRNGQHITMSNIIISGGFLINDFDGDKTPRVTITARAENTEGNILGLVQTTVSARLIHYKQ